MARRGCAGIFLAYDAHSEPQAQIGEGDRCRRRGPVVHDDHFEIARRQRLGVELRDEPPQWSGAVPGRNDDGQFHGAPASRAVRTHSLGAARETVQSFQTTYKGAHASARRPEAPRPERDQPRAR